VRKDLFRTPDLEGAVLCVVREAVISPRSVRASGPFVYRPHIRLLSSSFSRTVDMAVEALMSTAPQRGFIATCKHFGVCRMSFANAACWTSDYP
jgi:hypothetical protein